MALALAKRTQIRASVIQKCSKMHNIQSASFVKQSCNVKLYQCQKRKFGFGDDEDRFEYQGQKQGGKRSQFGFDDDDDSSSSSKNNRMASGTGDKKQGIVKWFDSVKGFGFITDEATNEDHFVHFSNLYCNTRFKSVEQGSTVEFELGQGNNGKTQALNVTGPDGEPVTPEESQMQQRQQGGGFGGGSGFGDSGGRDRDRGFGSSDRRGRGGGMSFDNDDDDNDFGGNRNRNQNRNRNRNNNDDGDDFFGGDNDDNDDDNDFGGGRR